MPPAVKPPEQKPDEYLEWLQEEAERINWLAEEARKRGIVRPTGGGVPPLLNPDGSLKQGGAPVGMSTDSTGHEHKGKGIGGGQFTAKDGSHDSDVERNVAGTGHGPASNTPEKQVGDFRSRLARIKDAKAVQALKAGVTFFTDLTKKIHAGLAQRYGSKAATAILVSGVAAGIPIAAVPGSTIIGMLPGVAIAETVLQFRKATGLSAEPEGEMSPEEMGRIFQREVLAPLHKQLGEWRRANAELHGLEASALSAEPADLAIAQAEAAGLELSDDVRQQVRRIVRERFNQ